MPENNPVGLLQDTQQGKEISPELKHQIDVYQTATTKLLHGKETQKQVLDMLKAQPIQRSIPAAAVQINKMLESSMEPSVDVVLANSVTLVADLFEIADAAGIAETPPEEEIVGIYQDTLQLYIQKGLKDGSIDPVELQAAVEPMMNEEQRGVGMEAMRATGLPERATQDMATEKLVKQATMAERSKGVKKKGMLQQGAQGGQQ